MAPPFHYWHHEAFARHNWASQLVCHVTRVWWQKIIESTSTPVESLEKTFPGLWTKIAFTPFLDSMRVKMVLWRYKMTTKNSYQHKYLLHNEFMMLTKWCFDKTKGKLGKFIGKEMTYNLLSDAKNLVLDHTALNHSLVSAAYGGLKTLIAYYVINQGFLWISLDGNKEFW